MSLVVLAEGAHLGTIARDAQGHLAMTYAEAWRTQVNSSYPLSLSMPLSLASYGHDRISVFLWGLLPENEATLASIARRFQVSARSAYDLLGVMGEDCAGAVQFVRPERVESLLSAAPEAPQWLDEREVAERLADLRRDPAAGRRLTDRGRFSLAGAQPKVALLYQDGRWAIPFGRQPTSHILKPPTLDLPGLVENEHFCLGVATALGLSATRSEVGHFGEEMAVVVERFDRLLMGDELVRIHQEDLCQALAIHPMEKYQNDGGPTPAQIVALLRRFSAAPVDDVARFVDALAFNWLIGGTDAHAKNYGVLIAQEGVRLAPLYDLISFLPYAAAKEWRKLRMAMKVGGEYHFDKVFARHWRRMAQELGLEPDAVTGRVATLAERIPDAVYSVLGETLDTGLAASALEPVAAAIQAWSATCRQRLRAG